MAINSQTFAIITNRLIVKCWKKGNIPTKFEKKKNRTKPGNPHYLVLFENRTKPGTVLSETVLSGDPLYNEFLVVESWIVLSKVIWSSQLQNRNKLSIVHT